MRDATRQLEQVRRIGRWLLLLQQLARWVSVLLIAMLLCGLVDFALRLPGWLRLSIGLVIAVSVAVGLVRRVLWTMGFRPSLNVLALRAERLYPQLAGVLASSVEFAGQPDHTDGPTTHALARASIHTARTRLGGVSLKSMIAPRLTVRLLLMVGGVSLVFGTVLVAAPGVSRLAAIRWLAPLGDAQWPNRTGIRSLVDQRVWPADSPLRFKARVERGYSQGMRAWVAYRVVTDDGPRGAWQSLLMNAQTETRGELQDINQGTPAGLPGVFERLVDLADPLSDVSLQHPPRVEFYFTAGDDRTPLQSLKLIVRPSVQSVNAVIRPPAYALDLVEQKEIHMDQQAGKVAVASALIGSEIDLEIDFNKPIGLNEVKGDRFLPGLNQYPPALAKWVQGQAAGATARRVVKSFVLDQSVQTPIHLTDPHGLSNMSERLYRIEAVPDNPPVVSFLKPTTDEAVLSTAVIPLEAVAQDDVGVEALGIEALVTALEDSDSGQDTEAITRQLTTATGRGPQLTVRHRWDLQPLDLKPGTEIFLTAVGRDVYELNASRHDPVRSTPRRLTIVDAATLINQIRAELAGVRQQAVRMRAKQQSLLDKPASAAGPQQYLLTNYLKAQVDLIEGLGERMQRNRLNPKDAGRLFQRVDRAGGLFDQAQQASGLAATRLGQAQQEPDQAPQHRGAARAKQEQVGQALTELINLLDQGRDALALQLQLQQLQAMQDALAGETRRFMPVTLGWSLDQLSKPERTKLKDLAARQETLAKLSKALLEQMQATADALLRQGESPEDQAAAQALAEAASIARRQGMTGVLKQAAKKAGENRLSDAGHSQQRAMDVMEKMLDELANVEQKRQAILRRRLVQLADAIRRLVEQQTAQIDRLEEAAELVGLDLPLAALHRNTISVADRSRSIAQFEKTSGLLDNAATEQSVAIPALRGSQKIPAMQAQGLALDHLKGALALVESLNQQAESDAASKKRQQLRQAYLDLAQEQKQIRDETAGLIPVAPKQTRRERVALINLGHREADLKIAAGQLQEQVGDALVFTYLHERVEEAASSVASRLRKAQPDRGLLDQQEMIASTLEQMARALDREKDQPPFAGAQGGGGGGGGGGQAPPIVPPLAELKLLREIQQAINLHTRELGQKVKQEGHEKPVQVPLGDAGGSADIFLELADQQRKIAGLGGRLIEKIRQQRGAPPGGP